jgi:hypothetical protein
VCYSLINISPGKCCLCKFGIRLQKTHCGYVTRKGRLVWSRTREDRDSSQFGKNGVVAWIEGGSRNPHPHLRSSDAEGIRASHLQHPVQDMNGDADLDRPTLIRHQEVKTEKADERADQIFGLAQREVEHRPERQRRQNGQWRIPWLAAPVRPRLGPTGGIASSLNRTVRSPRWRRLASVVAFFAGFAALGHRSFHLSQRPVPSTFLRAVLHWALRTKTPYAQ